MKRVLLAATAAIGFSGAAEAVTTEPPSYWVFNSHMEFDATDLNFDKKLTADEILWFWAVLDNDSWGPGSYYLETDKFGDVSVDTVTGNGFATGKFLFETELFDFEVDHEFFGPFEVVSLSDEVSPVPLPAGAALLPFALAGFGLMRLRKRSA